MSTFFTKTNHGRVAEISRLMGHLKTSANANGATAEDWANLMRPVIDDLAELTAGADATAAPTAPQATHTHWLNEIHMIRECAIENVPKVMAVASTRIEEHFDDMKRGEK